MQDQITANAVRGRVTMVRKYEGGSPAYRYTITGPTGVHSITDDRDGKRALVHLRGYVENNGGVVLPSVGRGLHVYRNQGNRDAVVVAVNEETWEYLVEYEMPAGTTSLSVIDALTGDYRAISYNSIPKHWLSRMDLTLCEANPQTYLNERAQALFNIHYSAGYGRQRQIHIGPKAECRACNPQPVDSPAQAR